MIYYLSDGLGSSYWVELNTLTGEAVYLEYEIKPNPNKYERYAVNTIVNDVTCSDLKSYKVTTIVSHPWFEFSPYNGIIQFVNDVWEWSDKHGWSHKYPQVFGPDPYIIIDALNENKKKENRGITFMERYLDTMYP